MRVSFIKYKGDNEIYRFPKAFGMDVFEIDEPEKIDIMIKNLRDKKYDTIVMPNDLAGFSQDIIQKYDKDNDIRIIITPTKKWNNCITLKYLEKIL